MSLLNFAPKVLLSRLIRISVYDVLRILKATEQVTRKLRKV